jgi:phage anti-repressor protein
LPDFGLSESTPDSFDGLMKSIAKSVAELSLDDAPPVDEPEPEVFEIEIYTKSIGNEEVNAVNARELWGKLESKQEFSTWIKARIEKYKFVSGVDFLTIDKIINRAKQTDYFISLDMAKELSMVENNEQGRKARRYFIECEKIAKGETPNNKIDLLSPEFIAAMRKVRTVQFATGMTKVQSSKFAREVIKREFGADMVHEVIGDYLQQLDLV